MHFAKRIVQNVYLCYLTGLFLLDCSHGESFVKGADETEKTVCFDLAKTSNGPNHDIVPLSWPFPIVLAKLG